MNWIRTVSVAGPAQGAPATVIVVDDDSGVSESLRSLSSTGMFQISAVESVEAFLACPRPSAPACVLTELRLPGQSGLDLQQQILDRPDLPVIFLSALGDLQATVRAMKYGAFDFLTKPCPTPLLTQVVLDALECSRLASIQLAHEQSLRKRYESLSPREREVMHLVVSGRLNKQAGAHLGISEITVKAHRGKMMRKMQAPSLAHLVNMARILRVQDDPLEPHEQPLFAVARTASPLHMQVRRWRFIGPEQKTLKRVFA